MNYDYVFDSYAWVEFFDGTEKGKKVKDLMDTGKIATSAITFAELSDKCAREGREAKLFVLFIQTKATIIAVTPEISMRAGKTKYELRKTSKNVSLADAIHYQTAKELGATFVTGDPDFENVKENVLFL